MRALEAAGYIKGYHAEIDRHRIGLDVLAFVRLDTERITGDATRKLEEAIRKLPEVVACHYISGTGTFELQVVAQDLDGFSRFARAAADEPAQREGSAHQLLAGRGQGQSGAAARASGPMTRGGAFPGGQRPGGAREARSPRSAAP